MKTRNALWKTYAQFYERLVTEEDMEYFESSFEIIKTQTK